MASGPAGEAWASLAPEQQDFIRRLPKAELHAHLNGCIPLEVLRELAKDRSLGGEAGDEMIERGLLVLANDNGVPLEKITDFFGLFPAIYALTSKPQALKRVTDAVLDLFLSPDEDGFPQCSYLELRTTPRKYQHMGRIQYLETVLESMARYQDRCALIVSVDWRMSEADVIDTLDAAIFLRNQGRGIVGIDLCGDFTAAKPEITLPLLSRASRAGLKLTVHIAESKDNPQSEADALLELNPDRLGHATFLSREDRERIASRGTPIEICLSSNLLCKTVSSLEEHHLKDWMDLDHPICICTDDTLPFRTNLAAEYSLLLAKKPLGLGLATEAVAVIAQASMASCFPRPATLDAIDPPLT